MMVSMEIVQNKGGDCCVLQLETLITELRLIGRQVDIRKNIAR
jgi:hypothetical protein